MNKLIVFCTFMTLFVMQGCMVGNIHSNKLVGGVNNLSEARSLVRVGMSQEQVRAKLGKPSSTYTQNNRTVWSFTHVETNYSGLKLIASGIGSHPLPNTKSVLVIFNASGRVVSVDFNEQTY